MALQFVGADTGFGTNTAHNVSLTALTGGIDTQARENDLVIVITGFVGNTDTNANPGVSTAGYTEILDLFDGTGTRDVNLSVNWKIMGASPDASVTCTGSELNLNGAASIAYVWRGADLTTPIDVTPTTASGSLTVPNGPSITPITAGSVVLTLAGSAGPFSDPTQDPPTGYANLAVSENDPNLGFTTAVASKSWTSGAEDPGAWPSWGTTDIAESWVSATIALRAVLLPTITTQPASQTVSVGQTATFSVVATE